MSSQIEVQREFLATEFTLERFLTLIIEISLSSILTVWTSWCLLSLELSRNLFPQPSTGQIYWQNLKDWNILPIAHRESSDASSKNSSLKRSCHNLAHGRCKSWYPPLKWKVNHYELVVSGLTISLFWTNNRRLLWSSYNASLILFEVYSLVLIPNPLVNLVFLLKSQLVPSLVKTHAYSLRSI